MPHNQVAGHYLASLELFQETKKDSFIHTTAFFSSENGHLNFLRSSPKVQASLARKQGQKKQGG